MPLKGVAAAVDAEGAEPLEAFTEGCRSKIAAAQERKQPVARTGRLPEAHIRDLGLHAAFFGAAQTEKLGGSGGVAISTPTHIVATALLELPDRTLGGQGAWLLPALLDSCQEQ